MTNPVRKAAEDWQAKAIDACMADPQYAAKVHSGAWCAACDMSRPCICDCNKAVKDMRAYYEANRRIEKTSILGTVSVIRAEPTSIGSWGTVIDTFMEELYDIATAEHKKTIRELRKRLSAR